jgi:O-succinylbenzoate synthase
MKASYAPYKLNFITPGGTSRGILNEKETYFIKIWDEDDPLSYGIGESALFRGLSKEDSPEYESKLQELCLNIENNEPTDLSGYSSIKFGLEGAILDFTNGCKRICFPSEFTGGKKDISINGLIWMGTKEEMLSRIDEKIKAGFRTLKLKIGAISFTSELEIIDSIRMAYPPDVLEIRLDANGAFSKDNAMQRLEKLSHFDIHSIEQPIKAGQWNEMSYLCANSPVPIALDEELIGITDTQIMSELLNIITPQYIILKPSLMGGISGAEQWLGLAAKYDCGCWITSALESNIGLNVLAQWTATLDPLIPQGLGTGKLYSNNIPSPLEQVNDFLHFNPLKEWEIPELNWK